MLCIFTWSRSFSAFRLQRYKLFSNFAIGLSIKYYKKGGFLLSFLVEPARIRTKVATLHYKLKVFIYNTNIKMSKFLNEFKEFAMKGNALDMAVGVIIGAAFGKIVSSIVDDIIMPPIGWLIGGMDFSSLKITLPAEKLVEGVSMQPATINYGMFIQNVIDFGIVAFCVFLIVKGINKLTKKKEETPAAPPAPSNEEKLLTEIRDLMKNK